MSTHTLPGIPAVRHSIQSTEKANIPAAEENLKQLSEELILAREEYRCALKNYEYLFEPSDVDICIYAILSAQCKYERILKQLRKAEP